MAENPLVSVVIPVWNRENLICTTLDSVWRQTYRPLEVVVADNFSTDGSRERVEEWIESHKDDPLFSARMIVQPQKGAANARNAGLSVATGEFVNFFDSDDQMLPGMISSAVAAFQSQPEARIVCWKCRIHLLDGSKRIPPFNADKPLINHLIHALLRPQGHLIRRDFVEKAGAWNGELTGWDDWEYGIRMLLEKPVVAGVDKVLAEIFSQEESLTGTDFSSKEGVWEQAVDAAREAVAKSSHPQKDRLLRILAYREIILAADYAKEGNVNGARKLRGKALSHARGIKKMLLNFAYHYTRFGLRGVWRLISPFY